MTPLGAAVAGRHRCVAELLLLNQADPNVASGAELRSPLHHAVATGEMHIAGVLLRYKADHGCRDGAGADPLEVALSLEAGFEQTALVTLLQMARFRAEEGNNGDDWVRNVSSKYARFLRLLTHSARCFVR